MKFTILFPGILVFALSGCGPLDSPTGQANSSSQHTAGPIHVDPPQPISPSPLPSPTPAPMPIVEHGVRTFDNDSTFVIPPGITGVKVTLVAGGGGSDDITGDNGCCSGASGGAGVAHISGLTPGTSVAVKAGRAGAGVTGGGGTVASFGAYATATGGGGGIFNGGGNCPYCSYSNGAPGTFSSMSANSYSSPGLGISLNRGLGAILPARSGLSGIVIVEY